MDVFVFNMKITAAFRMNKSSSSECLIFVFLIMYFFMRFAADCRKKMHKKLGKRFPN